MTEEKTSPNEDFLANLHKREIWKQLKTKGGEKFEYKQVSQYCYDAACLLKNVIKTFDSYTLHDEVHIFNVIDNMGKLLGDSIAELTEYECVMLLLSAFYHDIGMVYRDEDKKNIVEKEHFDFFITKNKDAKYEYEQTKDNLSDDFIKRYCRFVHHLRSKDYVRSEFYGKKINNNYVFANALGELCESHNLDFEDIKLKDFNIKEYANRIDLKFCALILRLADILDFDNTRSPDAVYKYLKLKTTTKAGKVSDLEWRKHIAANEGFMFEAWRKDSRYDLDIYATPTHIAVEDDFRKFLDVIEKEFDVCQRLVENCSERWRSFKFPNKIIRDNIESQDYRYGNYKFELQQDKVLELLMGENLYGDKKVFLRELLQNAIDTSRFREVTERDSGKQDFKAEPIVISDWKDEDGYQWVRIDDYGMGMDEQIILNYFLKIGQSYYTSNEFKLEKINFQNAQHQQFTPISRFGIGILSCFMVADKIEVSTRKKGQNALRLTLEDMQGFFILKEETVHHKTDAIPGFPKKEEGYRKEIGSSIAIRINPAKMFELDVFEALGEFVATSAIPIYYQNSDSKKMIGSDFETTIMKPWLDEPFVYEFSEEEMEKVSEFCNKTIEKAFILNIIPLDFTKFSPNPNYLKGQGELVYIENWEQIHGTDRFSIHLDDFSQELRLFIINLNPWVWESDDSIICEEKSLVINIKSNNKIKLTFENEKIAHNGIIAFFPTRNFNINGLRISGNILHFNHAIYIADGGLNNLNVTRDQNISLNSEFLFNYFLTLYRCLEHHQYKSRIDLFDQLFKDYSDSSLNVIRLNDNKQRLLIELSYFRDSEIEYYFKHIFNDENPEIDFNSEAYQEDFYYYYMKILAYQNKKLSLNIDGTIDISNEKPYWDDNFYFFKPLFFLKFNFEVVLFAHGSLNLEHTFTQWLLQNTKDLNSKYPQIFNQIKAEITYDIYAEYDLGMIKSLNVIIERFKRLEPTWFVGFEDLELTENDIAKENQVKFIE